jgi:nucleotide-binding universal stress UspA family protein
LRLSRGTISDHTDDTVDDESDHMRFGRCRMGMVLAAIDNSAAAGPVLATAVAVADLLHLGVEAVHVREDGDRTAAAAARAAGVALRELGDPAAESLVHEAEQGEVSALVLGVRGLPAGRMPAGHVALDVITSLRKPLVVVPPEVRLPVTLRRALVPLDGTQTTAAALCETIELVRGSRVEVVVLHVFDADDLPCFADQPQYEAEAWEREFLARYSRPDVRLELRAGVPGEHVLEVAETVRADLIVLGWAQDISAGRASVVREVLSHSRVPVYLVPRVDR